MNNDVTPAALTQALAQHRLMDTAEWLPPRCVTCGQKWPCIVQRLAEEVQRRRDQAGETADNVLTCELSNA